jgi:outer membrane protein TolC
MKGRAMFATFTKLTQLLSVGLLLTCATSARAEPEALADRLRSLSARPGGLNERDVAKSAARHSAQVRARRAEMAAAQAEVDKAVADYLPRATLTARYTRLSPIETSSFGPSQGNLVATPAGEGPLPPGAPLVGVPSSALSFPVILDQYTLQANLTVPLSDYLLRIGQSHRAAVHSRGAAELYTKAAQRNAAFEGKLAYFSWVGAKLENEVAKESLTQATTHLESAKALADVERASPADVLTAESRVASAELLVEKTRNLARLGEERLRTLMHDTSGKRYEIGDDFTQSTGAGERADFAPLYAEALRRRPEIRALDKSSASLRDQAKAVRSSGYPRLDAFGNAYYANPNQRYVPQREEWKASWDVGVQLSWTPNNLGTSSASSRNLEAQRERIAAEKQQLSDALRTEVFDAVQGIREAKVALDTSQRALIASEEAYRVRLEQYRLGRTSNVELSDAEAALLRARIENVRAKVSVRAARARLEHAVGR